MGSSFVICSEQMQNARKKIEALCLLGRINYGLLQQNVDIMSPLIGLHSVRGFGEQNSFRRMDPEPGRSQNIESLILDRNAGDGEQRIVATSIPRQGLGLRVTR